MEMEMDIGMFYGYEYDCFATDAIFISPNCAFIPLEINHAALYAAYTCALSPFHSTPHKMDFAMNTIFKSLCSKWITASKGAK